MFPVPTAIPIVAIISDQRDEKNSCLLSGLVSVFSIIMKIKLRNGGSYSKGIEITEYELFKEFIIQ